MRIGKVSIGDGAPLALIGGLNVLEGEREAVACGETLARLSEAHSIAMVFKASYDKANRTRVDGFRGPGIDEGLRILATVKRETGLELLTDVHDPEQAKRAAEVVDCLQVPAFLCRQTDLLAACAATGRAINLKKGQFVAPADMRHAVDKLRHFGARNILVTERGTGFGYHDLVADLRALPQLREFAPVCFDATHAVQRPGARDGASGGEKRYVAPLARAAVAVGVDALFIEAHATPERAPVDAACQLGFEELNDLIGEVKAVGEALQGRG
jgi:2-dehydro-3-deoxyphosphooctonate aldolase (KDO 8-P synthase)